jgi:hypothetical protein
MRSNQNLPGSSHSRVAGNFKVSGMPLEWLDASSWRLPSGKALAEFALQAGFLAPLLFRSERTEPRSGHGSLGASARTKQFGKGASR